MNTEQQAQLLEEIAAVMRERPKDWWREFEINNTGRAIKPCWFSPKSPGQVLDSLAEAHVRRRPRAITIAGIDVPEPMWEAPPVGAEYYEADTTLPQLAYKYRWTGEEADLRKLKRRRCHLTREAAEAHARAEIIASGGEVE